GEGRCGGGLGWEEGRRGGVRGRGRGARRGGDRGRESGGGEAALRGGRLGEKSAGGDRRELLRASGGSAEAVGGHRHQRQDDHQVFAGGDLLGRGRRPRPARAELIAICRG